MSGVPRSVFPERVTVTISDTLGRVMVFEAAEDSGRARSGRREASRDAPGETVTFREAQRRIDSTFDGRSATVLGELRRYRSATESRPGHLRGVAGLVSGAVSAVVDGAAALVTPYPDVSREQIAACRGALEWRRGEYRRLLSLWEATEHPEVWRAYKRRGGKCCTGLRVWWNTEPWSRCEPCCDANSGDLDWLDGITRQRGDLASRIRDEADLGSGDRSSSAGRGIGAGRIRRISRPDGVHSGAPGGAPPNVDGGYGTIAAGATGDGRETKFAVTRRAQRKTLVTVSSAGTSDAAATGADGHIIGAVADTLLVTAAAAGLGFLYLNKYRGKQA